LNSFLVFTTIEELPVINKNFSTSHDAEVNSWTK